MTGDPAEAGENPAKGFGDLWERQDGQTAEFDFRRYNTAPWAFAKATLAFCMITLVYLLYGLHELPWTLFGSAIGILALAGCPFFAGLILGYTFESTKWALASSLAIGFISMAACFFLMQLPYRLGLAEFGPGFMTEVWFYGFFVSFLVTISFIPAGAMVGASTNVHD